MCAVINTFLVRTIIVATFFEIYISEDVVATLYTLSEVH